MFQTVDNQHRIVIRFPPACIVGYHWLRFAAGLVPQNNHQTSYNLPGKTKGNDCAEYQHCTEKVEGKLGEAHKSDGGLRTSADFSYLCRANQH